MSSKKGISRNAWIVLKQVWGMGGEGQPNSECGNSSFEGYKGIMSRYFGMREYDEDVAIYCLTARYNYNYGTQGDSSNPFENIGPDEVLIPQIWRYEVKHNQDNYETEYYLDGCEDDGMGGGTSQEYGEECECQYATREIYNEKEDYHEEEECDEGYDDDCVCQEWKDFEIELFWWGIDESVYFSLEDDIMNDNCDVSCLQDSDNTILFDTDSDLNAGYDYKETWDYFSDSDYGHVHDWEEEEVDWEVQELLKGEPE